MNASYVEILRAQWLLDPATVPQEWAVYFTGDAAIPAAASSPKPTNVPSSPVPQQKPEAKERPVVATHAMGEEKPLFGISKKIAENMEQSLNLPTAMSTRAVPVKVLEENRRIINDYLEYMSYGRCSFTHLIAYAMVKAIEHVPAMNNGFTAKSKQ